MSIISSSVNVASAGSVPQGTVPESLGYQSTVDLHVEQNRKLTPINRSCAVRGTGRVTNPTDAVS